MESQAYQMFGKMPMKSWVCECDRLPYIKAQKTRAYLSVFRFHTREAENDLANLHKKKEEEKALKELRAKAQQKGSFGGCGLKKSGKK